jgi:hypothetical protein
MTKVSLLAALAMLYAPAALALKAPPLPSSAKPLSAKEVIELYDGATIAFDNYEFDKSLTGTSHMDFKKKTIHGDYVYGDEAKKTFKGKIRMKSDNFCYKVNKNKEACVRVYLDGSDIYEVNAKKVVTSKNKKM